MDLGSCADVQRSLAAWVDDELVGAERQRVSRHVEKCATCAARVAEFQAIGELVRHHASTESSHEALAGLAGSVVARLGAEEQASWRGIAARSVDGWQWAIVSAGAVLATSVNTALLVAILMFGPRPTNQDSLSAVMTNLGSPAGYVFAFVSPVEQGQATEVWQVDNGLPMAPRFVAALAGPGVEQRRSEADIVQLLAETVAPKGTLLSLDEMSPARRAMAEALLDEVTRLRAGDGAMTDTRRAVRLHAVRLVTSVTVKL